MRISQVKSTILGIKNETGLYKGTYLLGKVVRVEYKDDNHVDFGVSNGSDIQIKNSEGF